MNRLTSPHHKRLMALAVLLPCAVVGLASTASSDEPGDAAPPPAVELLSRGAVAKPFEADANGIELEAERRIDVAVAHLTFQPGSSTGWHRHTGPTVVTITAGELTITDRKCRSRTFEAGDAFVEEGPARHVAINTADTITETIVTFFVPRGVSALSIPASAPRCAD